MDKASIKQIVILLSVCLILVIGLMWFFQKGYNSNGQQLLDNYGEETFDGPRSPEALETRAQDEAINITNTMNATAQISTNYGIIEVELFEDQMPITAGNFIKLAQDGFYNGTKFHRVMDDFMIQGGDPNSKSANTSTYGTGGPGYAITDEHVSGEELTNVRGTIAMANSGPNSGGSQFFINLVDNTYLDFDKEPLSSKHPVFGRVVSGMEVVDAIGKVETGQGNIPVEPVIVESVTIVDGQ